MHARIDLKEADAKDELLRIIEESEAKAVYANCCYEPHALERDRKIYAELKNKNILVNCQVGLRGHTGSMLLRELGFNAVNLDGGYLTWINSPASVK